MSEGPPTSGSGAEPGAEPAQPAVPAGWYPHPTAPGWEAYWTGTGWGTETRQAQAAPAPAAPETPAEPQGQTEVQPDAGVAAAGAGQAAQAQPAAQTPAQEASAQGATDQTSAAAGGAPPGAAATATAAGATAAAPKERSNSSLPVVLAVLGAIVAIVGSFLPLATSSFDGIDFADNTMIGQSFGLAVIAVAVIGALLAVFSYLKGNRTWLVVLAGVVIIAIAAYMGLSGINDLTPDIPVPTGVGGGGGQGQIQISGDLSEAINPDASPSTGIFAVAVGGLLMALGGIGLARENR
ncbi:MAG: hypothetical protein U0R51_00365 [Solirubrobacterales bacterium]